MKFGFKERGNRQHGVQQPRAHRHVSHVPPPRHVSEQPPDTRDLAKRPRVSSHRNSLLLLLIFLFCLPASYATDPNKLKVI